MHAAHPSLCRSSSTEAGISGESFVGNVNEEQDGEQQIARPSTASNILESKPSGAQNETGQSFDRATTTKSLTEIAILWIAVSLVAMLVWLDEGIVATAAAKITD